MMLQVQNKRQFIESQAELREFEVALVDGFDDAIIGLVTIRSKRDPVVAYSTKRIIEILMEEHGCGELDDAYAYFAHNIEHGFPGPESPVFIEDDYECAANEH